MKLICKYIFIIFLSFCALCTKAQNLVPNPSFENYDTCPHYYSFIYYASPWFQPQTYNGNTSNSSSSDFFHSCGLGGEVDVPTNNMGNQFARTGNGYAGIFCHSDTINSREYIEVELLNSLVNGQDYCVEFYVSLADAFSLAVSNIGVYFSQDSLLVNNYNAITYVTPQIENDNSNFLTNKINWMKIFGIFTAQGGEKFMTIGNFRDPQNTNFTNVPGGLITDMSYYYIDDISVTACDTTLINVNEYEKNNNFNLYPNPNNGNMVLEHSLNETEVGKLNIYDVSGRLIDSYNLLSGENKQLNINKTDLENGIYFYEVIINDKLQASDKLIIIK